VNILILGPQGSGKGTQATRIAAEYGVAHVATGDMFRAAIAAGTPLGLRVQPLLASGQLVPDDLTIGLIRARLQEPDALGGFVLDGFPRTMAQAEALNAMLAGIGRGLDVVLELLIAEEICVERILARAREEGRGDDMPEVIAARLEIYRRETVPVVEHYRATGRLVGIRAERTPDEVFAEIQDTLEQVEERA
jgi:adenylate kinase